MMLRIDIHRLSRIFKMATVAMETKKKHDFF